MIYQIKNMENKMENIRTIKQVFTGQQTADGAGVKLRRIFGFGEEGLIDPFLLLDFFGSDNPKDYIAGFPWHPHRGIETVTYLLEGNVEHGDSMGNAGTIGRGDVQWMTAGSGIIHQEMPKPFEGKMWGFQLWVNLPAANKMMAPRYQEIKAENIPVVTLGNGVEIKVIAGEYNGVAGPGKEKGADPIYFDINIPAGAEFTIPVHEGYTVFVILFDGEGDFGSILKAGDGALMNDGNLLKVTTGGSNVRFMLISGKPIKEPIAWRGPIVMNTMEELNIAFKEYRDGTFVK
jgi:quercetin 2,3-dioxygenase